MPALPRRFIPLSLITLLCSPLCAYQQSSYFIYKLVDSRAEPTVAQRLPLERELLSAAPKAANTPASQAAAPSQATRSEFEIDYHSLGRSTHTSFETVDWGAPKPAAATATDLKFDLDPAASGSVFGN